MNADGPGAISKAIPAIRAAETKASDSQGIVTANKTATARIAEIHAPWRPNRNRSMPPKKSNEKTEISVLACHFWI